MTVMRRSRSCVVLLPHFIEYLLPQLYHTYVTQRILLPPHRDHSTSNRTNKKHNNNTIHFVFTAFHTLQEIVTWSKTVETREVGFVMSMRKVL
jgi:hypothetical protein